MNGREETSSGELLDAVIDSLPSSVIVFDRLLRTRFVNQSLCSLIGKKPREALGKTVEKVLQIKGAASREVSQKLRAAMDGGGEIQVGALQYQVEGHSRYFYYRAAPLKTRHERTDGVLLVLDDITKKVERSQNVQLLYQYNEFVLDKIPSWLILCDEEGLVLSANRDAPGGKSFLGREVWSFLSQLPVACDDFEERFREAVTEGEVCRVSEVVLTDRSTGCERYLDLTIVPVGDVDLMLLIIDDVTEKRNARSLQQRLFHAEKLSALGQFTSSLAHEINNPLAILSGNAQYLVSLLDGDELTGEKVSEETLGEVDDVVRVIDQEASRCCEIIGALLQFARRDITTMASKTRLTTVVRNTLKLMGGQLQVANVRVEQDMDPDMPPLLGNADHLTQVCMNIVLNAMQGMSEGGKLTFIGRTEGNDVVLRIVDTGPGIDPAIINRIFDPFFTTKDTGKGTGLGLSVAHSIIHQHGGEIVVDSPADGGRGTAFTIRLPIMKGQPEPEREAR